MAQSTALLWYLLKKGRERNSAPMGPSLAPGKAFYFDGTDDYISSNGNIGAGVAVKGTDGTGDYVQCYNTGFDMGSIAIDSRSVQTIKRRGSFDSFANAPICFGYWGGSFTVTTLSLKTNGTVQIEVQGTGSARIVGTTALTAGTEYTIIARINNTLLSGTARVVTDVDIFINGVKETLGISVTGNSTVTSSQAYRGAYSSTLGMTGKMRSLNIWNVALTDGECGTEGASSTVVNTAGLINSYTPSDVGVNIGRTGYDMNVSGNVSTGSDADGSYIQFNGNRDSVAITGSRADLSVTGATFTQATSFTMKVRTKPISNALNNTSGYFSYNNVAGITSDNTSGGRFKIGMRSGATVSEITTLYTLGSTYDIYLVYDSITQKFFVYSNGTLQNSGGTAIPGAFTASINLILGDNGSLAGNSSSSNKYIYHAAIRNRALTQSEIDADIALGNTAKNDPSIVAYYIPENLQYNTQYGSNPKALDQSNWIKTGATTVTADTTVAPDGTTTADTVAISGTASQGCTTVVNSISGSAIASKTFIVKAFVKVAAGTSLFRLECSHNGVATYNSSDQTATTTRQEFTFTQAFTSSTSGTGITYGLDNSTGATNPTLQVRNVRLYLVNETLRDESPNIGGFIGWKTPLVMSARVKPDIDSADTTTKQCFFQLPWHYMQLRTTNNFFQFRSETALQARTIATGGNTALGTGFRGKANLVGVKYRDGTGRVCKGYVNGVETNTGQSAYSTTIRPAGTIYRTNASVGFYSTDYRDGNIRDIRAYTFTGSFTDADALAIYNGGEPTSSGVTKYLQYGPSTTDTGTSVMDISPNNRDGTLIGGTQVHNLISLPLVSKLEYFSNTIGSTNTTNALTLTNTFDTNYTIVVPTADTKGAPRGTSADSVNSGIIKTYSYLTAGNTLTSIRNTGTTTAVTTNGYVVQLNSTLVNKVIQGTVTLAAVASNTVTGINCDPANSIVLISGLATAATTSNVGQQLHTLELSGTTGNVTLTAQKGVAATTSTVNYYIIEFNSAYINAIQKFSIVQGAAVETTAVATTYDLANTILFPAGMRSAAAATNANSVVQYAYLKNPTTVAVRSPYYTALATTTHTFAIVPFKQTNGSTESYIIMNGAQNVNNTSHTMGAVSTSAYTLPRSVTVNKSFILPSGVAINETAAVSSYDLPSTQITATNTVTATREGATLSAELGYQVIESI